MARVFVTGASGYMGRQVIPRLLGLGHEVSGLVRMKSVKKLHPHCRAVIGDPLLIDTFAEAVRGHDTFVHLVGVGRPAPWKARQFQEIDLGSIKAALYVAQRASIAHFVYVSVAHPAPIMRAYIAIRQESEARLRASQIPATVLRPWYVLGPGRRWPMMLLPAYRLLEQFSATRDFSQRLGLVTIEQMVNALVWAVDHPAPAWRIMDVPAIRRGSVSHERAYA